MITQMATSLAVEIAERKANRAGSSIYTGRAWRLVERNLFAVRSTNWMVFISGFVEPVFYLLSFGLGIGTLVGNMTDGSGHPVSYAAYIAPALLATSSMNGAIYDSTWNVFFKMHFGKLYQAWLATSVGTLDVALGEILWALIRGFAYAVGFLVVMAFMGVVPSWWAVLALPGAVLIAFGFASVGMGLTSYLTNFHQMNWLNFFMLPMFLFSGTFYPISVFPVWLQWIIQALPLNQAVELQRGLMLGNLTWATAGHAFYFVVMIVLGLVFTTKRLAALFQR
ncbi:MAG: ABC transporter permease [Actinomycetales bacterium]|nr:ABC transporter permease [Actinomycetales bacterium]